jgi:hypothetical protein
MNERAKLSALTVLARLPLGKLLNRPVSVAHHKIERG